MDQLLWRPLRKINQPLQFFDPRFPHVFSGFDYSL